MNAAGKSAKSAKTKLFCRVASIPLTDASNIRREKIFWFKTSSQVKTCLEDRVRRTGGPLVRWTAGDAATLMHG